MAKSIRLYASVAFAYGGQPAVRDILGAGYDTIIVWTVHVHADGTLYLNNTKIVSNGVYNEDGPVPMNLPARIAQLKKAGMQIIFSVGSGGADDFSNIANLLKNGPGFPGHPLWDNFRALKQAMLAAGGDIDAIDFDNEDYPDSTVMVNFGITLASIQPNPYAHVTLCPWTNEQIWFDTMSGLVSKVGSDFVNAIHLQTYSGGDDNFDRVSYWANGFKAAGGNAKMIASLATVQAAPGPWWYKEYPEDPGKRGANVLDRPNTNTNWTASSKDYLYTQNFASPTAALQGANTASSFFIYYRQAITLDDGLSVRAGDAVFFRGTPVWTPDSRCDAYYLGGPCSDIYNPNRPGACPDNVEALFKQVANLVDGGFIWYYDSMISCLLSECCKGSITAPTATALAYRKAIANGLS